MAVLDPDGKFNTQILLRVWVHYGASLASISKLSPPPTNSSLPLVPDIGIDADDEVCC